MASRGQCNTDKLPSMLILSMAAPVLLQTAGCESVISFGENYATSTDEVHARVEGGGSQVDLVLDHASAFRSKGNYLFGSFGIGIKLVPGYLAGTVTPYYVR